MRTCNSGTSADIKYVTVISLHKPVIIISCNVIQYAVNPVIACTKLKLTLIYTQDFLKDSTQFRKIGSHRFFPTQSSISIRFFNANATAPASHTRYLGLHFDQCPTSLKRIKNFRQTSDSCTGCCDHPFSLFVPWTFSLHVHRSATIYTHLARCSLVYEDKTTVCISRLLYSIRNFIGVHVEHISRRLHSHLKVEALIILLTFQTRNRLKKKNSD